jgi:hypothetical protein
VRRSASVLASFPADIKFLKASFRAVALLFFVGVAPRRSHAWGFGGLIFFWISAVKSRRGGKQTLDGKFGNKHEVTSSGVWFNSSDLITHI